MAVMTDTAAPTSPGAPGADEWVAVGIRPDRVVAAVTDTLSQLDDTVWAARTPAELLATMRGLEQLRSVLDLVQLRVVAEIDGAGAARTEGWASAKDYVTAVTGGHAGAGRRTLALARAVTGDRAATGAALAAGTISRTQAEVIVGAVDQLPVDPGLRRAAERVLIDEARDHDATDLAKRGRYVVERLDPDGAERRDERLLEREERAAHHGRFLSIAEDGIGGVRLRGRGTAEDAAWLKAVLFPLAAPSPSGEPGACGGDPAKPARSCGAPDCAHDGRDPREHGTRLWDALVMAGKLLAGTGAVPDAHGVKPRITVTLAYEALVAGVGEAQLDTGGALSAAAVRLLACDADILPIVLGSKSQILVVGRASRLVTTGLWLALSAHDTHCAFPGCNRPPVACDAHHITHWVDGGTTALDNLVLLCWHHHTTIHSTPWRVRLHPGDHRPEFGPPARLDPLQRPLRRRPLRG